MTQLNKLSLTSDRDYLEIHQDGLITISADGTPDSDSTFPTDPSAPIGYAGFVEITHNLESIPLVRAFWDADKNGVFYGEKASGKDPWLKVIADTSKVKLIMNTDGAVQTDIPVFYRLYDFGDKSATSDSRIDKIFKKGQTSGVALLSATSSSATETTLTITHNAGEIPLYTVQFSEDNINWYPAGAQIVGEFDTSSGPLGGPYSLYYRTSVYCYIDFTDLHIVMLNNYPSDKTLYIRYVLDYRQ